MKNIKNKDLDRNVMIKQFILPKSENLVPNDIDMKNLQIWSWNINGIRAVIKKNRIQEFFERANPTILAI